MIIAPGWTLRVSVPDAGRGTIGTRVHLFDGVHGACHRTEARMWHQMPLVFHPPTTAPTCVSCGARARYGPTSVAPEIRRIAAGRMIEYALASRDPAQLAVALRLLSSPLSVEPYAQLLVTEKEED